MSIAWGERGECDEWRLLGDGSSWGVRREARPGVEYSPPGIPGFRSWTRVENLQYEMPLGSTEDKPRWETVAEVRERLVKRLADSTAGLIERDPQAIDVAALGLVRLARALHRHRRALGAVHPESIILLEADETTEVVLPDWGFFWSEGYAAEPAWLKNVKWRFLWDVGLDEVNRLDQADDPSVVGRDARVVARIIVWLLLGEDGVRSWSDPRVGTPVAVSATKAGSAAGAEAWGAIDAALAAPTSDVKRAKEALANLETALEKWPPSRFFDELRAIDLELAAQRARARRWRIARRAAVATLAVALPALGWLGYRSLPDPPPPPPLCADCPGTTALRPGLEKLSEVRKAALIEGADSDSEAEVQALAELFALPRNPRPSFGEKEEACLERLSRETLESVKRDYARLKARLYEVSEDPLVDCPLIDRVFRSAETVLSFLPQQGPPPWFEDLRELRRLHCDR